MSNRFHNKWHRSSHHTYKNPDIIDSGWDPIASQDAPFRGDFVMQPGLPSADPGDPDEKWYMEAQNVKTADLYPYDENTNGVSVHGQTGENSVKIEPASGNETMNKIVTTVGEETHTLELPNVDGELAIGADSIISKTWAQLKAMRDANNGAGSLVSGHWYRITDYVATTSQADTQSANHPFDIIVMADAANKFNETAHAIQHVGDTYFNGCKLEAWKIKYCLDNDTDRFAWADTTNGKGVVYYLKDEFDNECPYDFKGIQFKRWAITDVTSTKLDSESVDSLKEQFVYDANNNRLCYAYKSTNISNDEEVLVVDSAVSAFYFTFDNEGIDASLLASNNVYGNKIEQYVYSNKLRLNSIVLFGSGCHSNTFGGSCYSNTFGGFCTYNTFGGSCYYNTFGGSCSYNAFGGSCYSNAFGGSCSYNTFGGSCYYNTFGGSCSFNKFACYFTYNTFGSSCTYNTFGGSCAHNTFGSSCTYNTFGGACFHNTFGGFCTYNTFGSFCLHNTFGHRPSDFSTTTSYVVGDLCWRNGYVYRCTVAHTGFWNSSHFVADSSAVARAYYKYITFENGVGYVFLDCTATRAVSEYYQNVIVARGVLGTTSSPRSIQDSNVNQTFKTTYQPANSRVISV